MSSPNRYCTPADVRAIIGLDASVAPDTTLYTYIDWANREVMRMLCTRVIGEEPSQDSGNLKILRVSHRWIADINFDSSVTKDDVSVYGWTDSDDESTKVALVVSSVYPNTGQIVLTSEPPDYEKLTVDYSYYGQPMDFTLLSKAVAVYAAVWWVARELFLVPRTSGIGAIRMTIDRPWNDILSMFYRIMTEIQTRPYAVGEREQVTEPIMSPLESE